MKRKEKKRKEMDNGEWEKLHVYNGFRAEMRRKYENSPMKETRKK